MKVSAILLVIGVSWVAAHPGLFDWQDNANKLFGGFSKNDIDDEGSAGKKKGLLAPVQGILENVNSLGNKLIPLPLLKNENLEKLDVLNLWNKDNDDGKVKDAASPLANIFGPDNLVGSIISSAVGSVKGNVLDVIDKFKGGIGGGKEKVKSSRKSSYQISSESSEKESESEKESSESNKSESLLLKDGKTGKIKEMITQESESEQKEKSSEVEIEQKSSEESSISEETEETKD